MKCAPPPLSATACLFLDVDGTLLDITPTPQQTRADERIRELLVRVSARLAGALALVSGRSLAQLDELLAPLRLPAAGLHGLERRNALGEERRVRSADARLEPVRTSLARFVAAHPGTLLEDKGASVAVHFRLAPQFGAAAHAAAAAELARLREGFCLQEGKCVVEIRPSGVSKASAIEEFLREPPFAGRRPVFAGDDLTDEAALRAVASAGGIAVAVGDRIDGPYFLSDPPAVRGWLASFVAAAPASSQGGRV
jgi:trehalose 6-phosphate phosphatase